MKAYNDVEEVIKYRFTNRSLLDEALITAGNNHTGNNTELGKPANKRLALVGDAVLRLAIVDHWWNQGDSSRRRNRSFGDLHVCSLTLQTESCENDCQQLASNENLSNRGNTIGLDAQIQKNPRHNGDVPRTAMASAMEAVIGAAWLDSDRNWAVTQAVATRLYCRS